jgi:hypothetical protein
MDKKLKKYSIVASTSDVYAVSLVDAPAVESNFIALSKQKQPINFKIQNEEKRMLYGVALRADFDIYRCYGEEEFYINFSKDAVRRLMTKFMKNHAQNNFTTDHMDFAQGLTVVESWIVENVENDKANALGLENFSEGSWIIGVKVDDDELWQSVKEGRWSGFSVEAFCDLEEITREIKNNSHKSDKIMAKKSFNMDELLDSIKGIIQDAISDAEGEDTETQEEVVEKAAEDVVEEVDANEEDTKETKETVEAAEETTPEEQIAEDVIEQVEDNAEDSETAAEDLQAVVDQLQKEVDDLKKENEELKKKNQKMSKMPSVKPNTATGGEQKFSAVEQLDRMGFIRW